MVPGAMEADYSSLKVLVYGASPISEEVLATSVRVFKCKFWQAYGLTETTGAVVNLAPHDHDPDGVNKHRTKIGNRTRTGSNNTFVAPIEIGDDAMTGGGTTVRRDVPDGALAVSAGPQRNLERWKERRAAIADPAAPSEG